MRRPSLGDVRLGYIAQDKPHRFLLGGESNGWASIVHLDGKHFVICLLGRPLEPFVAV